MLFGSLEPWNLKKKNDNTLIFFFCCFLCLFIYLFAFLNLFGIKIRHFDIKLFHEYKWPFVLKAVLLSVSTEIEKVLINLTNWKTFLFT